MNKEIKQILENQNALINAVNLIIVTDYHKDSSAIQKDLFSRFHDTIKLLNPEVEPTLPEKTKDALNVKMKIE